MKEFIRRDLCNKIIFLSEDLILHRNEHSFPQSFNALNQYKKMAAL